MSALQTCPRCEKKHLPKIEPGSWAVATRCQNCDAVIERSEHEAIAERARLKTLEDAKKAAK